MSRFSATIVLICLMLAGGSDLAAQVDGCRSLAQVYVGYPPGEHLDVNICPAGDFEYIGLNGLNPYASLIMIIARDASNNPIAGIPPTDYWLGSCDPQRALLLCTNPIAADSLTGADGRTTFTGRIAGGGCNIPTGSITSQGLFFMIQGQMLMGNKPSCNIPLCLSIDVKSPDLTGPNHQPDGVVNLSDFLVFSSSLNCSVDFPTPPGRAYNACCDFNDDNKVDLFDFSHFREHYLHQCQ